MYFGYSPCQCPGCLEVSLTSREPWLCWECEEAGCDGEGDCQTAHATCRAESTYAEVDDVCPVCGGEW
jgi:hypothetical protein